MPQLSVKDRIAKTLSQDLLDMVYSHQYPLSKEVCIYSFYNGLKSIGAAVELNDDSETMSITFGLVDRNPKEAYSFSTVLRFDEILRGNDCFIERSTHAISSASKKLFDEVRQSIPRRYNEYRWNVNLDTLHKRNVEEIDKIICEEILTRKDTVLVNRLYRELEIFSSDLMWEVFDRYDLEVYEKALELHSSSNPMKCFTPAPQTLLTRDWNSFTEENWPSPRCIEKFLWGNYLYEVAKIKGYESEISPRTLREHLVREGKTVLLPASKMSWGSHVFAS